MAGLIVKRVMPDGTTSAGHVYREYKTPIQWLITYWRVMAKDPVLATAPEAGELAEVGHAFVQWEPFDPPTHPRTR